MTAAGSDGPAGREPVGAAGGVPDGGAAPLVSYVVRTMPRLSETFVLREIAALHEQGVPLEVWTLVPADPVEAVKVPEFAAIAGLVRSVPAGRGGLLRMVGSLLAALGLHPVRAARAIAWALRWTVHDRDPRQAAALPYAAYLARHARGRHFHAHFANTPATTALLAGMLSAPERGASFTGHARDLWTATSPEFLREKIRRARFVVAGTETTERFMREAGASVGDDHAGPAGTGAPDAQGATPVVLARHGVEFAGRPEPARDQVEVGLVLAVGRLVEKKGFADLIDAIGHAARHGVWVRLALVGDGPLHADLKARAAHLFVDDRVEFHGSRSQDEITDLLGRAAIFALPCIVDAAGDSDTFPLAIVEALRAAVPVVTTTIGEMDLVLDDGVTARLVPPHQPELLGNALLDLARDPTLAATIGTAGRALAARDYDTARAVAPLIAAFREAARG